MHQRNVPMVSLFTILVLTLSANPRVGASDEIQISLAHGSPAEMQTRDELMALIGRYDSQLSDWLWTRKIIIDQSAIPHSHPVLTLHTRHLHNDLLLLSTFVHEEYHWYETSHPTQVSAAIAELKANYPRLPVGGPDGAPDEESSYLHVIVCYVEWQKMKQLVGAQEAHSAMEFWATDHYRAIYRLVIDQERQIGDIVSRHGLTAAPGVKNCGDHQRAGLGRALLRQRRSQCGSRGYAASRTHIARHLSVDHVEEAVSVDVVKRDNSC